MPRDDWKGTAFLTDREAKYSTSWQAEKVDVTRAHGQVRVEFTGPDRRAYFVLPESALAPGEDFDFG
jgi:hypothetical protein